ncbi:unnamed protein product, partial [marine sediment metagenome]
MSLEVSERSNALVKLSKALRISPLLKNSLDFSKLSTVATI